MEETIVYLLKSAGLISLFYAGYYFLLKNDTSFKTNRFFLIAGIITSSLLPFPEITRTIEVEDIGNVFLSEKFSAELTASAAQPEAFDWWQIAGIFYLSGLTFFLLKFFLELFFLLKIILTHKVIRKDGYSLIYRKECTHPFSFFRYIVLDPEQHSGKEIDLILKHEQAHVRQWHSVDQLLSSLSVYLLWFNPLAWLYRKSLVQNLEYLADREVLAARVSKKEYQKTLLKISIGEFQPALTNQFYQSFIKKRIMMLNKTTNQKNHPWKTVFLLPFLAGFFFIFNVTTEAKAVGVNQISAASKSDILNDISNNPEGPLSGMGKAPLYIIAGKEYTTPQLLDKYLQVQDGWSVLKPEKALRQYGKKAKDGVIILPKENIVEDFKEALKDINLSEMPQQQTFIHVRNGEAPLLVGVNTRIQTNGSSQPAGSEARNFTFQRPAEDIIAIEYANEKNQKFFFQETSPLIVVNGNIKDENFDINEIEPSTIKSMNVLKGNIATGKYGVKGKDGVIEIYLKSEEELKASGLAAGSKPDTKEHRAITIKQGDSGKSKNTSGSISKNGKTEFPQEDMLFIIDGKEMPKDFDPTSISKENIDTITILKGKEATARYGEQASNGVVNITTKK